MLQSAPRMRLLSLATGVLVARMLAACQAEIGDDCLVSSDCSSSGDRLCDTTMPGGYCTVFNCEPGSCPDEAICVAFGSAVSTAPACENPQGGSRLQRTFCLRQCGADSDCRSGYACIDMTGPDPWEAVVVEQGSVNGRVCVPPPTGQPLDAGAFGDGGIQTEVCHGTDGGFDIPPFEAIDSDPGVPLGTGGTGGSAGAAGAAGAPSMGLAGAGGSSSDASDET